METKIFDSSNLSDFAMFTKTLEKHILDGGSIIFPEMKGRYDVSKKFAKSEKTMANSYLTEIPRSMQKDVERYWYISLCYDSCSL